MATEELSHGPATRVAVRNLSNLKPEHQKLLRTLLDDPGMASATLETLAEHLLEEEDPRLQRALARVKSATASEKVSTGERARRVGVTVGSLRPVDAAPAPSRGTVGTLRKR